MIRRAETRDLREIVSIFRSNPETFSDTELTVAGKDIRNVIKDRGCEKDYFVAEASGKIVGCSGFERQRDTNGVYVLTWLAVHPDFQRKGVATRLYRLIEGSIRKMHGRVIFIYAGSGEANRHFYRRMGFRKTGRIPKYHSATKDLVVYCKLM